MYLPDSEARGKQHSSYAFCILPYEEPIEICMAPSPVFSFEKDGLPYTDFLFFTYILYPFMHTE